MAIKPDENDGPNVWTTKQVHVGRAHPFDVKSREANVLTTTQMLVARAFLFDLKTGVCSKAP